MYVNQETRKACNDLVPWKSFKAVVLPGQTQEKKGCFSVQCVEEPGHCFSKCLVLLENQVFLGILLHNVSLRLLCTCSLYFCVR